MNDTLTAAVGAPQVPERSAADRRMCRLLGLNPDAPKQKIFNTESVFGKSIAVSAVRCLVTYIFLPLMAPVIDLAGVAGPILGLVLGLVSMIAITISMRRFFAAEHKWRWYYAGIAGAIYIALVVAAVNDFRHLFF